MVDPHDNSPSIGDKPVQMLATAVQGAGVAVAISRISDGCYVAVNEAFENMFGFARSELLGRTSAEFGLWHDRSERDVMMVYAKSYRDQPRDVFQRLDTRRPPRRLFHYRAAVDAPG
jgi:PAS domain S-box-containing protein